MRHENSRRLIGLAALAAVVTLSACGGEGAEPVAAAAERPVAAAEDTLSKPGYGLVTADQAAALAADGVTVIDVRTPEEYAEGHIEGAQLIDFYSTTFAEQIAALDPDDEYLIYCRSGNRSGQTIALMEQNGIDQVWDLAGGVVAAQGTGLTLVR